MVQEKSDTSLPVSQGEGLLNAPLSAADHPLEDILDRLSPGQFLCGGRLDPQVQSFAQARGLTLRDYFAREELAVANAVLSFQPFDIHSLKFIFYFHIIFPRFFFFFLSHDLLMIPVSIHARITSFSFSGFSDKSLSKKYIFDSSDEIFSII